jgi:photosystem II stability/assembly factor-like uncharacterized protein
VLKSVDYGGHWVPVNAGLPSREVVALAIDPVDSDVLFSISADALFQSKDRGAHWSRLSMAPAGLSAVTVDATDDRIVYAVSQRRDANPAVVYRSANGGATWSRALTADEGETIDAVATSPSEPGRVWAAGSRVRTSMDFGAHWSVPGPGPSAVAGERLLVSDSVLLAAGGTNGLSRSTDSGRTWQLSSAGLANESIIALDRTAEPALYAATAAALFRSDDQGASWSERARLPVGTTELIVDPAEPRRLFATVWSCYPDTGRCFAGVARSLDGGETWSSLVDDIFLFHGLQLSSGDPERLYVLDSNSASPFWTGPAVESLHSVAGAPSLGRLALDPRDPLHLFGFGGSGLYASIDAGETWSRIDSSGTPNADSALVDPGDSAVLFAGGLGISRSTDGGRTWSAFDDGLEESTFRALAFSSDGRTLYAGSPHGIYAYTLCDACPVLVEPSAEPRHVAPRGGSPSVRWARP